MPTAVQRRRLLLGAGGILLAAGTNAVSARESSAGTRIARPIGSAPAWTSALTKYVVGSVSRPLPEEIVELAKRHLLDTLAAIVACRDLNAAAVARKFALAQSAGARTAPILGTKERAALLDAIFASAMCAHAAEINDFYPAGFVQPGASVVPALLSLGSTRRTSGQTLLRSMVVGYEISCRLPRALGNRNLNAGVLANHSVGPLFGVAAACAALLALPADRLQHVLSYCVQQVSGSWQWLRDVEHVEKAFAFAGMPARRGAECALLVESGFTGIGDPFAGDPGWLNSSLFTRSESDFDARVLTDGLGEKFELASIGCKRYPVGGPTQSAVELMLKLVKEVDPRRIRQVRVQMPGRAEAFASAEMPALNLPYLCSIIILDGELDFVAAQSRERFLNDRRVKAFMPNVTVLHDPSQERTPRVESARVPLTLDDGTQREEFLDHVKGFPEHPMERADVVEKARDLMAPRLGARRTQRTVDLVWQIERLPEPTSLIEAIAR